MRERCGILAVVVLDMPVPAPIASAYLKLIRAQEHMDPFVTDVRRWENSRPYRIVRETDHEAREHVVYGVLDAIPGDRWYGPVGDLVHNLHAALDHAVFGLSEFFERRPLTEKEAQSVYFPVVSDPAKWAAFVAVKSPAIRFLPQPYRDVIEREQPHRGSNDIIRAKHPMHALHATWNMDKHRQIGFFAGFGKVVAVGVAGKFDRPYRVTAPVVDNASDAVRLPISPDYAKEDIEPHIVVDVALQERWPAGNPMPNVHRPIRALAPYMHSRVFEVLHAFDDMLRRGVR